MKACNRHRPRALSRRSVGCETDGRNTSSPALSFRNEQSHPDYHVIPGLTTHRWYQGHSEGMNSMDDEALSAEMTARAGDLPIFILIYCLARLFNKLQQRDHFRLRRPVEPAETLLRPEPVTKELFRVEVYRPTLYSSPTRPALFFDDAVLERHLAAQLRTANLLFFVRLFVG